MLSMFFNVLKGLFLVIKYPLYFCICFLALFIVLCSFWFVFYIFKGKRLKKGSRKRVKKDSFFKKIFYKLPKQIVLDALDKDPDFFNYSGCIIFEGIQGSGKTMSMIEFAMRIQEEYPKCLCTSNLDYSQQDVELKDWRMLLKYKNGIYGVLVLIDELQNWFSSNDSKNFPPDMLTIITQNRKNRRMILGTSQVFSMLSKPIRTQTTELRRCTTLLGVLTIVRRLRPSFDSEGNLKDLKHIGWYFFIQNKKLRDAYDTYKVIERLSKVGFQEQKNIIENNTVNLIQYGKK